MIGYLVGIEWFSSDQGNYPNTSEFPSKFYSDKNAAYADFEEKRRENDSWSFGCRRAYIAPIDADGNIGEREY